MDAGDPMSGPNALERSAPGKIIDRVLSLFTDIRPEETTTALLLTFNIFCLLSGYYILKAVREGMILSKFPAELTSYIQAAQAFAAACLASEATVWSGELAVR